MLVAELIQQVPVAEVQKELIISRSLWKSLISQVEAYYEGLKEIPVSEPQKTQIEINRESFDSAYLIREYSLDLVEEITTFVSVENILASQVAEKDLEDLEKGLIVAGILSYLTHDGTCFSEEKRQSKVDAFKQVIKELKN